MQVSSGQIWVAATRHQERQPGAAPGCPGVLSPHYGRISTASPRLITHSPRPGNPPRLPDGTAIPGNVLGQHAVRDFTHFYLGSS